MCTKDFCSNTSLDRHQIQEGSTPITDTLTQVKMHMRFTLVWVKGRNSVTARLQLYCDMHVSVWTAVLSCKKIKQNRPTSLKPHPQPLQTAASKSHVYNIHVLFWHVLVPSHLVSHLPSQWLSLLVVWGHKIVHLYWSLMGLISTIKMCHNKVQQSLPHSRVDHVANTAPVNNVNPVYN